MTKVKAKDLTPVSVSYAEALERLETALDAAETVTDLARNTNQRVNALAVERAIRNEIRELLVAALASSGDAYVPLTEGIKMSVDSLKDAVDRIDKLVANLEKAKKLADAAARLVEILI